MTKTPLVTIERPDPCAHVLVVTSGWPSDDIEYYGVFVKRQVGALIERGIRCEVMYVRGYRSRLAYFVAALRLARWSLTGGHQYRLVHAHGEAALPATFYWRAPLLISYLGGDILGKRKANGSVPLNWRIRRALMRQHSRLAARTITQSRDMENALPRVRRAQNTILTNGVDSQLFRPTDRTAARAELGWPSGARIVLFAADPALPTKRYHLAKAAVERAQEELPDLRLYVASGVRPDRMPLLLNAADCLILTSSSEGSPNVVKEAMMCNLPVVTTPVGDVAELLANVMPSSVCEPSAEALAKAIIACLREPIRSNGREFSDRFDSRTVADSLARLYEEIESGSNRVAGRYRRRC